MFSITEAAVAVRRTSDQCWRAKYGTPSTVVGTGEAMQHDDAVAAAAAAAANA